MITLGVGLLLLEIANKATPWTGGANGLSRHDGGQAARVFRFDLEGRTGYVYSLVVAFAAFVLVRRVVSSPFGLSLRAIRRGRRRGLPALGATGRAAAGRRVHVRGGAGRDRRCTADPDHAGGSGWRCSGSSARRRC